MNKRIVLSAAAVFAASISGAEPFQPAPLNVYLSVGVERMGVEGDFDANAPLYTDGTGILVVPEVGAGTGFGIQVGFKGTFTRLPKLGWGFEVGWVQSEPEADTPGRSYSATYQGMTMDGRWFFNAHRPLQPFLQGGVFIPVLSIDGSYVNVSNGSRKKAAYDGFGYTLGAGAEFYFNNKVSMRGAFLQRSVEYEKIRIGGADAVDLSPALSSSSLDIELAVAYHFKP